MKSHKEIKAAHDFISAACLGRLPINFYSKDLKMFQAQCDVLCFVLECETNDSFQNSMDSLKELLGQVDVLKNGRKFKSLALVE